MDASGAFWYVIAGAALAFGGALVFWFRRMGRWLAKRAKSAASEAFADAIETHVKPQFEAIRKNTVDRAAEITREAAADVIRVRSENESNVAAMTEALRIHTDAEGTLVRDIVREEVAPLVANIEERAQFLERVDETMRTTTVVLEQHMDRDEQVTKDAASALTAGQNALMVVIEGHHSEVMAKIDAHDERLARIEEKLETP